VSDLSTQISTANRSLGVNTTTDSSEKGDGGATETISRDVLKQDSNLLLDLFVSFRSSFHVHFSDNRWLVSENEDLEDDERKSNEHESKDLTTSEGSIESSVDVLNGAKVSDFDVAFGSDLHSNESAEHGSDASNDESKSGVREPHGLSSFIRSPRHVNGAHKDDTEDGAENSEISVFFYHESVSTILNALVDPNHHVDTILVGPGHEV